MGLPQELGPFHASEIFSKVIIRFGKAITIPATLDGEAFEAQRLLVEERLRELYEDTDRDLAGAGAAQRDLRAGAVRAGGEQRLEPDVRPPREPVAIPSPGSQPPAAVARARDRRAGVHMDGLAR